MSPGDVLSPDPDAAVGGDWKHFARRLRIAEATYASLLKKIAETHATADDDRRRLFKIPADRAGNLLPMPDIFLNYHAGRDRSKRVLMSFA